MSKLHHMMNKRQESICSIPFRNVYIKFKFKMLYKFQQGKWYGVPEFLKTAEVVYSADSDRAVPGSEMTGTTVALKLGLIQSKGSHAVSRGEQMVTRCNLQFEK